MMDKKILFRVPRSITLFALFVLVWTVSFGVRTWHFNREAARMAEVIGDVSEKPHCPLRDFLPEDRPNYMPFTIESAMMFTYASDVAHGKKIPARDERLAYLPEVAPYAQMNLTLEWVLGYTWRLRNMILPAPDKPTENELRFQDDPAFARWVSFQIRTWTALVSAFVFLWLAVMKTPLKYAFAAGLVHAFSAAAVARATGQDIVRGEFCIPLIAACFVLAYAHLAKPKPWKVVLLGFTVSAAFASWDLCQLIFNSWALVEILRCVLGGKGSRKRLSVWIAISISVLMDALFVPFNRAYCLIQSPLLCVILPLTVGMIVLSMRQGSRIFRSFPRRFACCLILSGVLFSFWHWGIDTEERRSAYSHFSAVMKSKYICRNEKPNDPAVLDYDSRMMWTPSMHSADWNISAAYFASFGSLPGTGLTRGPEIVKNFWNFAPVSLMLLFLLILSGMLYTPVRKSLLRDLPRSLIPLLFTVGFIFGFMFIVRYHEFLILFFCILAGLVFHRISHAGSEKKLKYPARALVWIVIAVILFVESTASLFGRRRAGEGDQYIRETARLIEWFRSENMRGKTVVSDFTISPMLLAYCGTNLVMQPQFGLEKIRRPVEQFLTILYHGDEQTMARFCGKYNAEYFVFDRGITGPPTIYSMRYIANAAVIRKDSCAALMQSKPETLSWFYRIVPPEPYKDVSRKYFVYKIIRPADRVKAIRKLIDGEKLLRNGETEKAARLASEAFELDPASPYIRSLYFRTVRKVPFLTLGRGVKPLTPR